jgi:hypothetical protein
MPCILSQALAKVALGTARRMRELPETSAALLNGEITREHARIVMSAFTTARADELRELEPQLVKAAKEFSTRDVRTIVRRVTDAIDGDGGASVANEQYEQRRFDVAPSFMGLGAVNGNLDAEATELLITALEKRMADDPDTANDRKRSRAQRRHDALRDICRIYLAIDEEPSRQRSTAQVGVIVDVDLLRSEAREAVVRALRGDLAHVGAVSAETLRRFTCDCDVHRVLTKGRSEVLDVGRSTRTSTKALRRALEARDGGCTEAGCNVPAAYCEIHHIVHWADGGETNLDNCELRCWRHHRDAHEGARARAGP